MNYVQNISTKWNVLDSIIYSLESGAEGIVSNIKACREKEPDPEVMIEAQTKYLKEENEHLKELQYPRKVNKREDKYYCPNKKCQMQISNMLVEQYRIKHCPECGQRIY